MPCVSTRENVHRYKRCILGKERYTLGPGNKIIEDVTLEMEKQERYFLNEWKIKMSYV